MSDKTKKDYDPTVMRAAGNILASGGAMAYEPDSPVGVSDVKRAVSYALALRDRLKKVDPQ
jgi:hypothetical protein